MTLEKSPSLNVVFDLNCNESNYRVKSLNSGTEKVFGKLVIYVAQGVFCLFFF